MLQMEGVMHRVRGERSPRATQLSGAALAAHIDRALSEARAERSRLLQEHGMFSRFADKIDSWLRTDEQEHLDDPNCPDVVKLRVVGGVHLMNVLTFSYQRFYAC
jgi:hypothetical protein